MEGVFVFVFGFFVGARVAVMFHSDAKKKGGDK